MSNYAPVSFFPLFSILFPFFPSPSKLLSLWILLSNQYYISAPRPSPVANLCVCWCSGTICFLISFSDREKNFCGFLGFAIKRCIKKGVWWWWWKQQALYYQPSKYTIIFLLLSKVLHKGVLCFSRVYVFDCINTFSVVLVKYENFCRKTYEGQVFFNRCRKLLLKYFLRPNNYISCVFKLLAFTYGMR